MASQRNLILCDWLPGPDIEIRDFHEIVNDEDARDLRFESASFAMKINLVDMRPLYSSLGPLSFDHCSDAGACQRKKDEIMKTIPSMTRRKFLYNLSRASHEKNWGHDYLRPTFREKCAAFFVRLIPRIGPLRVFRLSRPTPDTEHIFEASFNAALDRYKVLLGQVRTGQPDVPNSNFDTGEATPPGTYSMNDHAHAKLLESLAKEHFAGASPELRAELLRFYADPDAPYATKRKPKDWNRVVVALEQLRASAPASVTTEGLPALH